MFGIGFRTVLSAFVFFEIIENAGEFSLRPEQTAC